MELTMDGITGAVGGGAKNASSATALIGGNGLNSSMDALRKSLDALNISMKDMFVGDDPKADEDVEKIIPLADKGVLSKAEGKDAATQDSSPLVEFNAMLAKSTEALGIFREGLGLPEGGDASLGSSENGFSGIRDLMPGGNAASDEIGDEAPKTGEEVVAEAQETADALNTINDDTTKNKEANNKAGVDSEKMTFDKGFSQAQAAAKKLGLSEKHTAVAGTIVSTARAIAKANEKGFPANIPLMAQAAATGAMQLGVIKGQFHDGIDSVPSSGTYLLEKGERVLDKRLNADLKGALEDGKIGSNTGNTFAQTSAPISPTMNVAFNEPRSDDPDAMYEAKMKFEEMLRDIYDEHATRNPFDN